MATTSRRATERLVELVPPLRPVARRWGEWRAEAEHRRVMDELMVDAHGLVWDGDVARAEPYWLIENQPGPRLDLYVRVLALEEFAGLNAVGVALYEKFMRDPVSAHRSAPKFEAVLRSVSEHGLLDSDPLVLHRGKILGNGWHRLACAIFLGIPRVPVRGLARERKAWIYSAETLRERGFTPDEIELVLDAERRALRQIAPQLGSPRARVR